MRPVLAALASSGGSATYKQVVDEVGRQLKSDFTPMDLDELSSGGVRWQSRIQFVRLRLIERGLMERDSARGIWSISPDGRALLTEEARPSE